MALSRGQKGAVLKDFRGGGKGGPAGPRPKLKAKDRPKLKPSDKGFGNG